MTQKMINEIAYKIIGCAIEVHKNLGPGLLESVYQACLIEELKMVGLNAESQVYIPILYKGKNLGGILKLDILVESQVVVEIKAVDVMIPIYQAQLLSYLKIAGKPKGLLINFHCVNIVKGMIPMVTENFAKLPVS
jgi:GxxExxY protein